MKRAKKEHLEDSIMALPWIAMVDKFQHWIYENPQHTAEERDLEWDAINKFHLDIVGHQLDQFLLRGEEKHLAEASSHI